MTDQPLEPKENRPYVASTPASDAPSTSTAKAKLTGAVSEAADLAPNAAAKAKALTVDALGRAKGAADQITGRVQDAAGAARVAVVDADSRPRRHLRAAGQDARSATVMMLQRQKELRATHPSESRPLDAARRTAATVLAGVSGLLAGASALLHGRSQPATDHPASVDVSTLSSSPGADQDLLDLEGRRPGSSLS